MDKQANDDVAPQSDEQQKGEPLNNEQSENTEEALDLKNEVKEAPPTEEKQAVAAVESEPKENGETQQQEEEPEKNEEQKEKDEKVEPKPEEKPVEHTRLEQKPRIIVKHSILGNRIPSHDQNVLVESTTFTSIGKIQPFLITISTNAALVMDFHCHLTTSEVVGYLAGNWDVNSHNLNITHAFPCKCRLGDYESAPVVENEIRKLIKSNRLTLAGWYHSHPTAPATPSLRDIDTQLDYELRMKGNSDSTYLPCVGVICSPYNVDNPSFESNITSYWVIPPPENKIHEYGKPMMMSYSVVQDQSISHEVLLEMKKCADFYKPEKDYIRFNEVLKGSTTYIEKLKASLSSKFPLNHQKGDALWSFVKDVISTSNEKSETEILKQIIDISSTPSASSSDKGKFSVPSTPPLGFKSSGGGNNSGGSSSSSSGSGSYHKSHKSKSSSSKRSSSRDGKNLASLSNYFVGSDLATALFGSGKFPMGLDPATKSLLNLNSLSLGNMFLPPMAAYKPEPNLGLMKPPPPPSTYYPYSTPRSSSRSSPSSSRSRSLPSTSRDMPPPNKVPKLDVHQMANFFIPPNLGKNCTVTSRPSTSTK
ncbi:UNVERIFIED_CONTAM: hypothetical protein PYX00_006358 [Menopon gallinae]|uniref:MPN domain-containing protein n=1 Tax=Menopon gallinae TaxID=328185 RepID=A0AAW2HVE4_9NEOP